MEKRELPRDPGGQGAGCAFALLVLNTLVIGLVAMSFAQGPYSSPGQELWYRYGSLAFLAAGSVLPGIVLAARPRSQWVIGASMAWMAATLLGFLGYAVQSGGGM